MARYKRITLPDGTHAQEHRVIWEKVHGPIPKGCEIHHINGNGKDNRIENLIMLTKSEHQQLHADLRRIGKDPVDQTDPDVIRAKETNRAYAEEHREEIASRKKEYQRVNRDTLRAKRKIYQQKHGDVREAYRERNKEAIAAKSHEYYMRHRDETLARQKEYRETHREEIHARGKRYYRATKEHKAEKSRQWYEQHHDEYLAQQKEYRDQHRDEINARARAVWASHREESNARHNLLRAIRLGRPQEVIDRLQKIYDDVKQSQTKRTQQ